jgi:hypothetical protein
MRAAGTVCDDILAACGPVESWPKPGELVTLERLAVGDYIRVASEDVQYLGHVGGCLILRDDLGRESRYESSEGELFGFVGSWV